MMDDPDDSTPDGWSLLFPFLPVRSKGGPFDDQSYVAGYEMGRLDRDLDVELVGLGMVTEVRTLREENERQAELIAMHHGWMSRVTDRHEGGWITVQFAKTNIVGEG